MPLRRAIILAAGVMVLVSYVAINDNYKHPWVSFLRELTQYELTMSKKESLVRHAKTDNATLVPSDKLFTCCLK